MKSEKKRKHLTFYGSVQGVGLRYRARQAAGILGLTGWVRNEFDGSVTMEIQGTDEEIDRLISMVDQGRYVRIDSIDVKTLPLLEDERGFRSRR